MKGKTGSVLICFIVYALLAFPSFYFVYKFADPIHIAHDFFSYYHLYNNWDIDSVNAPFNMRLVSSFGVYLFHKTGIFYQTGSSFDQYVAYGFDKSVYFSAVFFNFLCVVFTSVIIFFTVKRQFNKLPLAFVAGLIYLLGFGTLFYELMPLTDSFSVMLFAAIYYLYLRRSYFVFVLIALTILQREYILVALGLLALVDYLTNKDKYYLRILLASAIGFAGYYVLRKTIFYTPVFDFQTSPAYMLQSFSEARFPVLPFIRQTLINLNIYGIYLLLIAYKYIKKLSYNKLSFLKLGLLLFQVIVISIAAGLGNNCGRLFYLIIPMLIFELAAESEFLFSDVKTGLEKA